jgi:type II secretory pathway component PulJ
MNARDGGFVLVGVLVAIAIASVGIPATLSLLGSAARSLAVSAERAESLLSEDSTNREAWFVRRESE